MNHNVLNTFPIGENTSVTIKGNGQGLKNNIMIKDSLGMTHKLLSIAMVKGELDDTTTLLIEGNFDSEIISV